MESNFTVPQRQSAIGIVVMFFDTIQQYGRALWPILLIWVFRFNEINKLWLALGVIGAFLVIGIIAYLKYLNFTFFLDNENDAFIITEGVFNKSKTTIQLNKIQQVNIKQSLIQRIIGVHTLDVDTAGSHDKEVAIRAISHHLALELKARLLENEKVIAVNSDPVSEQIPISENYPFINISLLSLLKVAITSNYIRSLALLLAFVITFIEKVESFTDNKVISRDNIENYISTNAVIQTVVIALVMLFMLILIINIFRIVVRYFDYKITKQKGSLLLSFGLINTKSTIIKPEKVQIISVTRNYFQKKMNIMQLKIKQATGDEREEQKQAIEIPGCNETERDAILNLLFSKIPEKGEMLKPNYRKLVFAIFLSIVLPLCCIYAVSINDAELAEYNWVAPVYAVFIGLILFFSFQNYRLFINNDFIIKQSGAWDIKNEMIEPQKIQAITTSQLFWHKSADIGYLTIHTAGGNVGFQLGNFTRIKHYVNLWLYEMETSDSNWM